MQAHRSLRRPASRRAVALPQDRRRIPLLVGALALSLAAAGLTTLPAPAHAQAVQGSAASHPTRAFWNDLRGSVAARSATGADAAVTPAKFRALTLDPASMASVIFSAPAERSTAARQTPTIISLPDPAGGYQRFAIVDSPVMEPGLAARHPNIRTFAGRGIDDPTASIRGDITPQGFHASVRSKKGSWFIDPYYRNDTSVYASYYRKDYGVRPGLTEGMLAEPQLSLGRSIVRASDRVEVRGAGFAPGALVAVTVRQGGEPVARQTLQLTADAEGVINTSIAADPYRSTGSFSVTASDGRNTASSTYRVVADGASVNASTAPELRTYRLALLSDPGYANYHGLANVTAAKVTLMNRVTQVYEDETSIRFVLIANNDALNLDTAAQFSQPNGPCGGTACYPSASVSCSSATLTRTRLVIGLLVGASNFDIGHIGVGAGGGGIASLGVVGGNNKAQGCTGLPTPVGDLFAVDYVAHEMGHQFAGNHTFNGANGSCSGGNRSAANSVEPGSGSSIMAYAGICGANDDLQPHSDPYWSGRSFDEITTYVSGAETVINEVQYAVLSGFNTNGQTFQIRYNGVDSAPITRGVDFTTAGVQAAIQAIPGWPAGATATVSTLGDTAFTITFGGALAGTNVSQLELVNCTGGCTGKIGEVAKGGTTTRQGSISATGNSAPVVTTVGPQFTIPLRTPFALTGSAVDANGDTVTYMWEQLDRGGSAGTALTNQVKTNGPLFRQFSFRADVTAAGTLLYNSPGENAVDTNPTRVFPDMAQILANNTNAETGTCTAAAGSLAAIDCFSEFLPTSDYVGFTGVNASPLALNFRLTARDGKGGVNSAPTQLLLASGTGPFLVTAPNTAVTLDGASSTTVTWNVAGTNVAPINTANVKISLSTDGGLSFPITLAASTPNDGAQAVTLPNVNTTKARIKVEAVGNVYFDVSNADFTIRLTGDLDGNGAVDCTDLAIVRASFGKTVGQPGFDARADVNNDGIVDLRDLVYVSNRATIGTRCPS